MLGTADFTLKFGGFALGGIGPRPSAPYCFMRFWGRRAGNRRGRATVCWMPSSSARQPSNVDPANPAAIKDAASMPGLPAQTGPKPLCRHGGQEKDLAPWRLVQHMGLRPGSLLAAVHSNLLRRS